MKIAAKDAGTSDSAKFNFWSADLSSFAGCSKLVENIVNGEWARLLPWYIPTPEHVVINLILCFLVCAHMQIGSKSCVPIASNRGKRRIGVFMCTNFWHTRRDSTTVTFSLSLSLSDSFFTYLFICYALIALLLFLRLNLSSLWLKWLRSIQPDAARIASLQVFCPLTNPDCWQASCSPWVCGRTSTTRCLQTASTV